VKPSDCVLVGTWQIVEADIWDRAYLDLCGPAKIVLGAEGAGEIAFGELDAYLDLQYAPSTIFFRWNGADDMTEVQGEGAAELQDDGSLEIQFSYDNGDAAILKARRI
jgi:hypothetical protein